MKFPQFLRLNYEGLYASGALEPVSRGTRIGGRAIILSRALCAFETAPAKRTDRKGRAATALKLARESRFTDPGVLVLHSGDVSDRNFACWTWDNTAVKSAINRRDLVVLPETVAREPGEDGQRLCICLDGYEGQSWRHGRLVASRWWPQLPSDTDWRVFAKAAPAGEENGSSIAASAVRPEPVEVPFREDLSLFSRETYTPEVAFSPRNMARLAVFVLTPLLIYQVALLTSLSGEARRVTAEIAEKRSVSQHFLEARRAALSELARTQNAARLGDNTATLGALADLSTRVDPEAVNLRRLLFDDGEIEVWLDSPDSIDGPALLEEMEETDTWNNVSLRASPNDQLILSGELSTWKGAAQ